jgi:C-terminal processing protease CtpA/Prc
VSATPDAPALRELLAARSGAPVSVAAAASPEGFGLLLSSEILDGRLTARGLEISDPGLSRAIGLRPGDLVVSVNDGPIAASPIALARIARDPDALLIIQIERQGQRLALTVRAR